MGNEKETFQLRLRLAKLESTQRNTLNSEDYTETYDGVIRCSPATSYADQILLPSKGALEANHPHQRFVSTKRERVLHSVRNLWKFTCADIELLCLSIS